MLTVLLSDLLGWLLQVPMAETAPTGAGQLWASQWPTDADFSGLVRRTGARTEARTSVPNSLVNPYLGLTERHRSRTCLASGYDAVLVLKTSWGTGPRRSAAEPSSEARLSYTCRCRCRRTCCRRSGRT